MVELCAVNATAKPTDTRPFHVVRESLQKLVDRAHPGNPKDHDLGLIITSIVRFGFVSPVLLDEKSETMIAGHGRVLALIAMREEGYDVPEGIIEEGEDWLVPVIRGVAFRSDHDRDAYLVADNSSTILGGWDNAGLIAILSGLHETDPQEGMRGTGFDASDLQALIEARDFQEPPPSAPPELMRRYGISITVNDKEQENRIGQLLTDHGFTSFQRFSEG